MEDELVSYFNNNYEFIAFKGEEVKIIENSDDAEMRIINSLRIYYNNSKHNKKNLNEHLILLENKKLELSRLNQNSLFTALISVIMSLLGAALSIIIGTNSLVVSFQSKAAKDEDTEKMKQLGAEIIGAINAYEKYIVFMCIVVFISAVFVAILAIREIIMHKNDKNTNKIINMHKSVIEERLKEIEKEDETSKVRKEMQETLEGAKREIETLRRIFEKK